MVFWLLSDRSQKRKYLQGKRGIEKPPFRLPEFIRATGITKIRDQQLQLDLETTAKTRQRQRVRPKKGKMTIDYSV